MTWGCEEEEEEVCSHGILGTALCRWSSICSTQSVTGAFEGAGVAVGQDKCAVSNHELKAFAIKPSAFRSLITSCLVHWLR